jgi:LacI family transcriptional regulator
VTTGRPTAVVCANHLLAPWLLVALDDAGLRLPRDVSLVVHGDSDWARAYLPPLSVIRRDIYAEGFAMADGLLDAIAGEAVSPRPPATAEFVERGSCGPPPE